MLGKFWQWYERRYNVIAPATAFLFLLQVVHLYWMTTNIVFLKISGQSLWNPSPFWNVVIALIDYTEIPAIISSSLLYILEYQRNPDRRWLSILFLILINSQWIHLFWITDEVIYAELSGASLVKIPVWLSYLAIAIDYLEIPVMADTMRRAAMTLRRST